MIVVALCRPDLDRTLAAKLADFLWSVGQREAEFYVWGTHEADA